MSADNWTTCPKCRAESNRIRDEKIREASKSYGKVTPEVFVEIMREAEKPVKVVNDSLREDYCQGIDSDGQYSVTYRACCDVCGFEFRHEYSEKVKV